jgi:hypothetical protein
MFEMEVRGLACAAQMAAWRKTLQQLMLEEVEMPPWRTDGFAAVLLPALHPCDPDERRNGVHLSGCYGLQLDEGGVYQIQPPAGQKIMRHYCQAHAPNEDTHLTKYGNAQRIATKSTLRSIYRPSSKKSVK